MRNNSGESFNSPIPLLQFEHKRPPNVPGDVGVVNTELPTGYALRVLAYGAHSVLLLIHFAVGQFINPIVYFQVVVASPLASLSALSVGTEAAFAFKRLSRCCLALHALHVPMCPSGDAAFFV